MGNDNSKATVENQQMILQLQQQILNNQRPNQPNIPNQQHQQHHQHQQTRGEFYNRQLPVISAAELQQWTEHPNMVKQLNHNEYQQSQDNANISRKPNSLFDILNNKKMMEEVDKNPNTKRKLLEKLLNEHRHIMTTSQVQRITTMLDTLPPADNNSNPKQNNQYNQQNYSNVNANIPSENNSIEWGSSDNVGNSGGGSGFNQGTTNQDPRRKALQTTQQLNTIDALSKHYKTEAEREEAEFKIEEERRRKAFLEKQRQRRMNYQAKLSDLDKHNIDALKMFQLGAQYTLDELKQAYKKLAMKTHPDKPGGNVEQFQLITKCYMSLLEKYKNRESDKHFSDLKKGSKNYLEDQQQSRQVNKQMSGGHSSNIIDKDKFDAKLFNKIYEDNKLWESGDDGYGSWFSSEKTDDEAPNEIFGNKFNLNVFNSTFEDYKEKITSQSGAIQEYREPQELISCSTGFTDIDIYARKIDDFSKPLPIAGAGSGKELAYTDLKTAYTSKGAFIDPSKIEYKTYKSVDELKRDRGNISYDMTPDQMREYEMTKYREREEEERRQDLIRQRDNIAANTYSKMHEKMLGWGSKPP